MVRPAPIGLLLLVFGLALSAWTPAAQAGTAEAPEITDPAGDHKAVGTVPVGATEQFLNADILAGWITEDVDELYFNIQIAGAGAPGTAGPYTWTFRWTAGATELEASGTTATDGPTPGGVATAAAFADGVVTLTVPRSALEGASELTGCHIRSRGGTPAQVQNPFSLSDIAPDAGADAGISYTVTGGSGGNGTLGDSDGDGLNDTKETEQFGNLTAQNGTGDPDGDGLNNSAEFDLGTNATKADTDGDGLNDKEDPSPLDPSKPGTGNGTGNATADLDKDGLPDAWEKQHFNSTTAQTGSGDPDADGLDNKGEYAAGTDPNDPDTDGDGLNDSTDPKPLTAETTGEDRLEMYAGAPMFAAIATLCLFALGRNF
ncbi:MAG TPA: hypothetical protein VM327_00040 [Candidatus Thermoplasmatota archaeon]|nr:hypothetical protein [Candidatus Thermoplasmatota archaeon]